MANNNRKTDNDAASRRPIASASFATILESEYVTRETSYESILEISLSLMTYVRFELGTIMKESPEVAENLGPMLTVMHEVSLDLESHRQIVDAQ